MSFVRTSVGRKLQRSLILAAASTFGLLAVSVAPAAATTLSHGNGFFTATSVLKPPTCSAYGNYQATMVFTVPPDAFGTFSGPAFTVNVKSKTGDWWGEFADGTHPPVVSSPTAVSCSGAPAAIDGFTGTAVGTSTSGQVLNCTLGNAAVRSSGTYLRNGTRLNMEGEDITYTFSSVSGACLGATTPVVIKTSIVDPGPAALCNSPIAPSSCVLGPAKF